MALAHQAMKQKGIVRLAVAGVYYGPDSHSRTEHVYGY